MLSSKPTPPHGQPCSASASNTRQSLNHSRLWHKREKTCFHIQQHGSKRRAAHIASSYLEATSALSGVSAQAQKLVEVVKTQDWANVRIIGKATEAAGDALQSATGSFASHLLNGQNLFKQLPSTQLFRALPSSLNDTMLNGFPSLEFLSHSAEALLHKVEVAGAQLASQLNAPDVTNIISESLARASTYSNELLYELCIALGVPYRSDYTPLAAVICLTVISGSVFLLAKSKASSELKGLPARYDPDAIEAYFRARSSGNHSRALQVLLALSSFAADVFGDKVLGVEKENEKRRATELVTLITSLGPTAVKIGQALSIRPDLLPVPYLEELQKLQDRVPAFSNKEAKELILEGLGKPSEVLFTEFSAEPVAAASLGQVYKAKLGDCGDIVAVKVQRPGVLEGICRDLYIMRNAARRLQSLPNIRSDLVALLDNWAFRFFDELDYVREGENAIQFSKNMKTLPNIRVPAVYMQYTSRKVLTTQWVEGERLSESKAEDLLQLVKVALNCYLMQLLESGFLHADPHPGNLLRTQDGCLCVLDYGLMTQINSDQQYAFIDYISHLVNADYALVAEDLIKLGFVPPELVDPSKTAAVVPQLSRVLGQLVQGGGARKVNFQQVTDDLSSISRDYVFIVPPYFALILRAFSVLEGIGLAADSDYAILDDCVPYLCKRLLTDDSPRTRAALKYFVYAGREQLDVSRVENIISGFQSFQKLTAGMPRKAKLNVNGSSPGSVDFAVKEVLQAMFAPNGSYLQELLLTELVRTVDALSRDAVAEIWQYFASRALISLPPALMVPKSWPLPLPGLFFGSSQLARLSVEDQQSLDTVKRLWALLEPQLNQRPTRLEMRQTAGSMIPLITDLFPGMVNTSQRFLLMLLQRQALRLADDLDGRQSVEEWNKDPSAFVRRVRPIIGGT